MNFNQAIKKIGRAMGKAKYHDTMSGTLFPKGNLDAESAIAIIYDVDRSVVAGRLHMIVSAECQRQFDKMWKDAKKKKKK